MLQDSKAFGSYSCDDLAAAKKFYGETLGLTVSEESGMGLKLQLNTCEMFIYPKPDHQPATFTVLNFSVDDIEQTVDELTARGVQFEHYSGELQTDERGIAHGKDSGQGPNIAWFKDPAGNILAVIQL